MTVGVFDFGTNNLGDDMQSCAIAAHLNRVDRLLNRDRLADVAGEPTACIFNSWFLLGDDFRPPSEAVRPIWFGFCAGRPELLDTAWRGYLRRNAPIGCRDLHTADRLIELGIDAFWTGCLTLFLGHATTRVADTARRGVVFVDVPQAAERFIPNRYSDHAVRVSTFPPPSIVDRPLARLATLANLVELLRTAELVVTRRLHVALPAAGFGTRVVAIPDATIADARRRFSGFETVMPVYFLDELESGARRIDWTDVPPPMIPSNLLMHYERFRQSLDVRGVLDRGTLATSPLESIGRRSQRIENAGGSARPGRLRLRLRDRTFDVAVDFWSNRFVDISLRGFPGLSKFDFRVEACAADMGQWVDWGRLRDLVRASED